MANRINHNRSIAVERSVINDWELNWLCKCFIEWWKPLAWFDNVCEIYSVLKAMPSSKATKPLKPYRDIFTYLICRVLVPPSSQESVELPRITLIRQWRNPLLGLSVWRQSSFCPRGLEYHGLCLLWWCVWRLPWLQWEQGQSPRHQRGELRHWYLKMPGNIQIYLINFSAKRDEPYKKIYGSTRSACRPVFSGSSSNSKIPKVSRADRLNRLWCTDCDLRFCCQHICLFASIAVSRMKCYHASQKYSSQ